MSGNEDMLSLLGSPWSLITRVSEIRWPHAYSFNYTACEMAESGSVTFIQQPTQWMQGVPQQSVDPNGEPIVYKARCLVQQFEDALFRSYSTNVCLLTGLIGVLVSWSQHRRRSREVAASWQLYVTDRSFVYTIVDSGHPSTIRIPLAHIETVAANEPLAECGPATCLCSTGPDAVVVTLKREYRSQYGARCSGRLAFRYAENADEFADAVRRQMSAGSYWVLQAHWTVPL